MEIKGFKHKNLTLELLKKLLNDEIKIKEKQNLVKSKALLDMLQTALNKYQNGLLTTAQIIQELIEIARQIRGMDRRGEELGLTRDELAFYDALETNDSAVKILGDETLRKIAVTLCEHSMVEERENPDSICRPAMVADAVEDFMPLGSWEAAPLMPKPLGVRLVCKNVPKKSIQRTP